MHTRLNGWWLAAAISASPALATDYNESVDGDLSDSAGAPTALSIELGSNALSGTVENSNDTVNGDRDFFTFTVPDGHSLSAIMLTAWSPSNTGFAAINDGSTGFVPGGGTISSFMAGIHVRASLVGTDLLESMTSASVTTNSLAEPNLGPGTYTVVIQQTSALLQSYALDLVLESDAPACTGDIADDFGSPSPDGMVSFGDFLALLGLVGPCPGGTPGCSGDIADDFGSLGGDGMVSFGDFLALLGLVGPCP